MECIACGRFTTDDEPRNVCRWCIIQLTNYGIHELVRASLSELTRRFQAGIICFFLFQKSVSVDPTRTHVVVARCRLMRVADDAMEKKYVQINSDARNITSDPIEPK